jgi:hypothetical protein
VVNVEVELLERPPKFRVLANLRTDWDPVTGRRLDEVPMRRHLWNEQVRWISCAGTGEGEQRERPD